jgi:2-amino-4-hydroxy-6-hydroxymethyldihydropteridine diphosphokinase
MVENIFLGLGSNKGDRLRFIKKAVLKISEDKHSSIDIISSVYESEPYGNKNQDYFLNAVIKIKNDLSLEELCPWIKGLEKEIGRVQGEKWGPREIDIDLLFFNDLIYNDGCLIIPHKELLHRDFVVVPMQEVAPDFEHPVEKIKMKDINLNKIEKLIFRSYKVDLLNH